MSWADWLADSINTMNEVQKYHSNLSKDNEPFVGISLSFPKRYPESSLSMVEENQPDLSENKTRNQESSLSNMHINNEPRVEENKSDLPENDNRNQESSPSNIIINTEPMVEENQSDLPENDNRYQGSPLSNLHINDEKEKPELNEDDEQVTLDKTPPKQQQKNESKEAFFSLKRINEEMLPRINLKENLKLIQIVSNEETVIDLHKGIKREIKNLKILHDRKFNVNIMKTIKARIFNKYLRNFFICFLQLFNLISNLNIKFKKLNYEEIIHNNTKSDNLSYLNMKIADFLSIEPFNKSIILKILLKYKDNYNKYVNFIFNMTLRDYIKIFIFKKELDVYITDLNEEDIAKIKTIFFRADTLLNNEDFSKERIESIDEKKNLGKDDTKSLDNINNKTKKEIDININNNKIKKEIDINNNKTKTEIDININNNKTKTEIDDIYYSTFMLYLFNFIYYYESMKERKKK